MFLLISDRISSSYPNTLLLFFFINNFKTFVEVFSRYNCLHKFVDTFETDVV